MSQPVLLTDIIGFLGGDILNVFGNPEGIEIHHLREPQCVDKYTLDWINSLRPYRQKIAEESNARTIIADPGIRYDKKLKAQQKVLIIVDNPKLAIAKIGNVFFVKKPEPGIHSSAIVHPEAIVGDGVYIGPNVCIGACKIGNNVMIYDNAIINDDVEIKPHVKIHAGVIVGVDGLGCEREKNGLLVTFPHLGGVVLEENVQLGAGTIIAKGALSNTVIGYGSKLNIGCFVAHNVKIGANAWISPKVNIAGSVNIGVNVTIFSGVIIREQRTIGDYSTIGMGAVVTKDVPSCETWVGNPAKKLEK